MKNQRIVIRCSEEQKKIIRELAKNLGMTVSQYMLFKSIYNQ